MNRKILMTFVLGIGMALQAPAWSSDLMVSPTTFDFGWSPDNAEITAVFNVKNPGSSVIPLTAVQPSCGCTAADFTAEDLSADQQRPIKLTFNTRGYTNMPFRKRTDIKAGTPEKNYEVIVEGFVTPAEAPFAPTDDGVASFSTGASKKQVITLQSKLTDAVELSIIQNPAEWAQVRLKQDKVEAGQSADVEISVDGDLKESRHTSVTLEAKGGITSHRVTLAIRTGGEPEPYRKIRPSNTLKRKLSPPASPAPQKAPK
jgi:hypothetical protein